MPQMPVALDNCEISINLLLPSILGMRDVEGCGQSKNTLH